MIFVADIPLHFLMIFSQKLLYLPIFKNYGKTNKQRKVNNC